MRKIKSRIGMWLALAAFFLLAAGEMKLVKTRVNDKITVVIPNDWRPMDNLDFSQRYPSVRAPLAAYSDMDRLTDFSVNISATQWPDEDVAIAKQFFKASLMNTFDRVDIISEGVHKTGGKEFIYFEFESRINGNRQQQGEQEAVLKYTYIQYFIQPGKAIVFSFNCPRRMKEEWQPIAHQMMKGIKMK